MKFVVGKKGCELILLQKALKFLQPKHAKVEALAKEIAEAFAKYRQSYANEINHLHSQINELRDQQQALLKTLRRSSSLDPSTLRKFEQQGHSAEIPVDLEEQPGVPQL